MFRDKSLIPVEAIRLAALGFLSEKSRSYAELARDVRLFVSHVAGPSLDLTAPPLTLLRYEGLVLAGENARGKTDGMPDPDDRLHLSPQGHSELARLLHAPVRAPLNDISRLVIALKIRFLDRLSPTEQGEQVEMLIDIAEQELARVDSLSREAGIGDGLLPEWLEHEKTLARSRRDWFRDLHRRLTAA